MSTKYRKGYELEKLIVDRLNNSGLWLCQRGPSSKGIDVLCTSKKYVKTVFLECKNTEQTTFSVTREQIEDLIKKGYIGGAEVFVAINWRGRHDEHDKRRKLLRFYPFEFLVQKLENKETKTILFKPFDYSMSFEEVFFPDTI